MIVMKRQTAIKIIIDILMTLALLFLMGYPFWGERAHEWIGTGLFVLFILHHILNRQWYSKLCKGKYPLVRCFTIIINILLMLAMLGLMVSSIILSNHVFTFVPLSGMISVARTMHMTSSYGGYLLMSLHLGLHWGMILSMIRKHLHLEKSTMRQHLFSIIGLLVALYGLYALIQRNILDYLFIRTAFVFFDFNEPIFLFYMDYLAIMGTFIFISCFYLVLSDYKKR